MASSIPIRDKIGYRILSNSAQTQQKCRQRLFRSHWCVSTHDNAYWGRWRRFRFYNTIYNNYWLRFKLVASEIQRETIIWFCLAFWNIGRINGARSQTWTGTTLRSRDFKSLVSTDFTTRAWDTCYGKLVLFSVMEAEPGVEPRSTDLQSAA